MLFALLVMITVILDEEMFLLLLTMKMAVMKTTNVRRSGFGWHAKASRRRERAFATRACPTSRPPWAPAVRWRYLPSQTSHSCHFLPPHLTPRSISPTTVSDLTTSTYPGLTRRPHWPDSWRRLVIMLSISKTCLVTKNTNLHKSTDH